MSKELLKKSSMIQEEELQLLEFNLRIHITIRKLRNYILLLKVCFQDKLFSVEKRLLFKLEISFQLVSFLKVLLFLMLNLEKVTMVNLLELLVHLLLLLPILKMVLRLESNFHLVLERLLIVNLEVWLELLVLVEETRNQFLKLVFNIGDIKLREKISQLLLVLEWTQLIIHTEVVIINILVNHQLFLEDVYQVKRLVLLLLEELVYLEVVINLNFRLNPIEVKILLLLNF